MMAGSTSLSARSTMPTMFAFSLWGVQSALHLRKRTSPFCVNLGADIWSFQLFPASQSIFHISLNPYPVNSPTTGHLLMRHTLPILSFIYSTVTLKRDKGSYKQISHHLQKHSAHWCLASNLKFWPNCSTSAVHLFWKPGMAQARSIEVMMGEEQLWTIDCFYYCVSKYMGAKPVWFDWNSGQCCWNISS